MEADLFTARIDDTADITERTQKCKYLGFLSPEQAAAAALRLKNRGVRFAFWGGYEEAQRVMLGCFPDWADGDEFPLTAVTFKYRPADTVSHRDVLGSLMGLGFKREAVGDILIGNGYSVAFVSEDIADYIVSQLEKIGRVGVTAHVGFEGELPKSDTLADFSVTVASLRLDCVVAAIVGISRGAAAEKITQGFVSVNSFATEKITLTVNEGDIITVRGKGKFIIGSDGGTTRKNRVVLNYKKYV